MENIKMPSSDLAPQSDNINFTETFIDDLSHDLKNLVQNLPAAPELPEKLDSSKKRSLYQKSYQELNLFLRLLIFLNMLKV